MKTNTLLLLLISIVFTYVSCKSEKQEHKELKNIEKKDVPVSKGDSIVNLAITAHGGTLYDSASYKFTFRKKEYTFTNTKDTYQYSVKTQKENQLIEDVLDNGKLTRKVNGEMTTLNPRDNSRYKEALNSVVYFATLPYKLNDGAVNKKYKGEIVIKGENYFVVEITFNQDGGGKDFEDQYYYWIHTKTHTMDYLAYNYKVNNGGVRFRSSYNRRNVDGILFQDYINYKAEVGTPLADLPALFEKGELKEVSRIDTESVVNLKNTKNQ
ncbi:DUF6503 family protein [Tenacibaculum agarivorans]|uniref:DUF6503 family protein n=1 Tax=Tenacibaculum agarivorans TaxID=1908389 RepID=UPI00094B8B12|nr:DUF6503 family protein [Tenacibaculum agarivorans]